MTTPTPQNVTQLITRLAMAGHNVVKGINGDFDVSKQGMSKYCPDYLALLDFAKKLGVIRHE